MENIAKFKTSVDVSQYNLFFSKIKILESQINYKYDEEGILRNKKDNLKISKIPKEEYDLISQYTSE